AIEIRFLTQIDDLLGKLAEEEIRAAGLAVSEHLLEGSLADLGVELFAELIFLLNLANERFQFLVRASRSGLAAGEAVIIEGEGGDDFWIAEFAEIFPNPGEFAEIGFAEVGLVEDTTPPEQAEVERQGTAFAFVFFEIRRDHSAPPGHDAGLELLGIGGGVAV